MATESREDIRRKFHEEFDEAIDGPNTVECVECGLVVLGDDPDIGILCWPCYQRHHGLEPEPDTHPFREGEEE